MNKKIYIVTETISCDDGSDGAPTILGAFTKEEDARKCLKKNTRRKKDNWVDDNTYEEFDEYENSYKVVKLDLVNLQ